MSRWIDVDDIIAEQKKYCFSCEDGEESTHCSVCFAKDIVSAIIHHPPSIDIVRCKECKWHHYDTDDECRWRIEEIPKDDDFCSWGERKSDE